MVLGLKSLALQSVALNLDPLSQHCPYLYIHTMLMGFMFFPIQYLGKWYYVGVASWDDEDIESYKSVDNSVVELKKSGNNTLIMAAALHQ